MGSLEAALQVRHVYIGACRLVLKYLLLKCLVLKYLVDQLKSAFGQRRRTAAGTQFTCFTGTKVPTLTVLPAGSFCRITALACT
jgi:hypothetical protein